MNFEGRNKEMILPKDDAAKESGSHAHIECLLTGTEIAEPTAFLYDNTMANLQEQRRRTQKLKQLAIASVTVASADLASQISQVKSKDGLKKCTSCRKHVGLMGFSCKCGDLFCAVHHYSNKHKCPFDYRNAGQNAIAKGNPIIVAEKLNKI
ncbi:Zinc finger A20 and AN1 domain-containing stress-associated protein 9 [Capsicum baccatum]|uniref:Zinc finger A20 and AN1 domain-containing stress-associated protein 9 n=1 Tax=Capsicum baccatum TaxID=33114 RepID=A0A2G2V9G1_CAPBA|nr:Zinc finger A20 and AN1 domain-containing stress-associated protein 9 [Capsicum baccatum]